MSWLGQVGVRSKRIGKTQINHGDMWFSDQNNAYKSQQAERQRGWSSLQLTSPNLQHLFSVCGDTVFPWHGCFNTEAFSSSHCYFGDEDDLLKTPFIWLVILQADSATSIYLVWNIKHVVFVFVRKVWPFSGSSTFEETVTVCVCVCVCACARARVCVCE